MWLVYDKRSFVTVSRTDCFDNFKIESEERREMNGIDLINNLIDELGRAKDLLRSYVNGAEVSETTSEGLIDDITRDLDRYYDVADSIDVVIEGIKVE